MPITAPAPAHKRDCCLDDDRRRHGPRLSAPSAGLALLGCLAAASAGCRSDERRTPITGETRPPAEARALSEGFEAAAQAIRPCVVRLDVEGRRAEPNAASDDGAPSDLDDFLRHFLHKQEQGMPARRPMHGTGSGIIIDAAGDILTSSHVLRGMTKVSIRLVDKRTFSGKVVGIDPVNDVGVVRFDKIPPGLVAARFGDSDHLRIGQWVIAVGSPLGMQQTVTAGIVSGVGETGDGFKFQLGERVRKYIQTDAEMNPGNSGGPLVELTGAVVGLNTLIGVGPGGSYGFAIPINQAFQAARTLIKKGTANTASSASTERRDVVDRSGAPARAPADQQ